MAERRQRKRKRNLKCRECPEEFEQIDALWDHIKALHGPIEFLNCKRCHYRATARSSLERHYLKFHRVLREEAWAIQPALEAAAAGEPQVCVAQAGDGESASRQDGAEEAPVQQEGRTEGEAPFLSLSPCPISPLMQFEEAAPEAAPPLPVEPPRGKPRGMLAMMANHSPPPSSSPSSLQSWDVIAESPARGTSPPPGKVRRLVTVRIRTTTETIYRNRMVKRQVVVNEQLELVELDAAVDDPAEEATQLATS